MPAPTYTIIEMRQERASLWEQAKAIHEKAVQEKRALDATEQEQYDKIMKDVDRLKATIDREERMVAEAAELEGRQQKPTEQGGEQRNKPTAETEEYRKAFFDFLKGGAEAITPEQRSLIAQERRALSVGTAASGGYTVPVGFYNSLIETLKWYGGMRQSRASVWRTATGNDLQIPIVNDTANVAVIVGENAAAGLGTDPVFSQKTLKAYKYSSQTLLLSLELLQDSAFDLEAYLRRAIAERFGRGLNAHFTNGTGTGQPQGIVTGAALGKTGAVGQTTSVTWEDLVDLEHTIDPSYRAIGCEWMFHDNTLRALKKLKDAEGRPLWMPGVELNAPDKFLGYSYVINNDMAQMAADAKSILFGDMSKYVIRDVMDVLIVRIAEKYIESGQVGFVAFSRHDGQLVDPGTAVKYYANSAT